MKNNFILMKSGAAALFMLLFITGCGLFRAKETPVVVVLATPTPEVIFAPLVTPPPEIDLGPPEVVIEILDTPLPELFGGFATPTPDPLAHTPPVFIVIPPTPTHTPYVIFVTATPIPPTPTPDIWVVLPETGADLTALSSRPVPAWPLGVVFMGILLVVFGIFRQRR
jgi:hypothetical protein